MKHLLTSFLAASFVSVAHADDAALKADFKAMVNSSTTSTATEKTKGPFGPNVMQYSGSRNGIGLAADGINFEPVGITTGTRQFDGAFRNRHAQKLIDSHQFYTGNLFTTNYYTLMGNLLYNKAESHELDHASMQARAAELLPEASLLIQHWVLEKYYVALSPSDSRMVKAFNYRGVSDTGKEQVFAEHFYNFYLSAAPDNLQYLSAMILAQSSTIGKMPSLNLARTEIASLYDEANAASLLPEATITPAMAKQIYDMRMIIHNNISKGVLKKIDSFLAANPTYNQIARLQAVRNMIADYYSVSPAKLSELAKKAGASSIAKLALGASTPEAELKLAQAMVQLRDDMTDNTKIPSKSKAASLVLLLSTSQYLTEQLIARSDVSKQALQALVHLIYAEGYLLKDNHDYFVSEIAAAADAKTAYAQLPDIISVANEMVTSSLGAALPQWQVIESKTAGILDNSIKSSSAFNAATQLAAQTGGN